MMNFTAISVIGASISQRENEILGLLSLGYTSRQIGDKLFISELTVQTHRRNMLRKLGLTNSQQLIRWGFLQGLLWQKSA